MDPFASIDTPELQPNQVRLSTGEVLEAVEARGYHVQKAQQLSGGKPELFSAACMSVMFTSTTRGALPMEEYPQMLAKDFNALFNKLMELGFIG